MAQGRQCAVQQCVCVVRGCRQHGFMLLKVGPTIAVAFVLSHFLVAHLCRQLWDSSWLAVLHSTPLQELAAEKAAMAQGGWTSDVYQDAVQRCPLFRAVVVTAAALQDAAQVVVSGPCSAVLCGRTASCIGRCLLVWTFVMKKQQADDTGHDHISHHWQCRPGVAHILSVSPLDAVLLLCAVQPAINPAAELQKAAAGLMPQVNDPAQQEVFADVVTAAAAVAGMST